MQKEQSTGWKSQSQRLKTNDLVRQNKCIKLELKVDMIDFLPEDALNCSFFAVFEQSNHCLKCLLSFQI